MLDLLHGHLLIRWSFIIERFELGLRYLHRVLICAEVDFGGGIAIRIQRLGLRLLYRGPASIWLRRGQKCPRELT